MGEWGGHAEPLSVIAKDDPITCAIYACDNNLLELEGWQHFKSIANRELKFRCLINQVKLNCIASCHATSMVMRYPMTISIPWNLILEMETNFGGKQQTSSWLN
jgi:hypothetical protein